MHYTLAQRMAASTSPQEALKRLKKGFWKTALTSIIPMMGFIKLYAKGNHYVTLPEFLDILLKQSGSVEHNSPRSQSGAKITYSIPTPKPIVTFPVF